jgi:hypothetical protein
VLCDDRLHYPAQHYTVIPYVAHNILARRGYTQHGDFDAEREPDSVFFAGSFRHTPVRMKMHQMEVCECVNAYMYICIYTKRECGVFTFMMLVYVYMCSTLHPGRFE